MGMPLMPCLRRCWVQRTMYKAFRDAQWNELGLSRRL